MFAALDGVMRFELRKAEARNARRGAVQLAKQTDLFVGGGK
jgi:hypothetical protein